MEEHLYVGGVVSPQPEDGAVSFFAVWRLQS
jgi:hypothetical protein